MKKMFRVLLCVTALALTLCTSAFAADSAFRVELNGQEMSFADAAPQIVNDRSYLPFRAVFTALGFADEDITYQDQTKTVSAASPELTVSMVIGENKVSITKGGETTVLDTDVPAFIDPALGRTYVPVSFVAQAVGYRVGWNAESRTVIIDDVEGILAANAESYQVLEQYLDYGRTFQKKNYKVEGEYAAQMVMVDDWMEMGGTYEMLMSGNTKFDFEMDMALFGVVAGEDLSSAVPEKIALEMRGDMKEGAFYFKSEELMSAMQTGMENIWFKMDLAGMIDSMAPQTGMTYMGMMDMSQDMMEDLDGKAYIEQLVRNAIQSDNGASTTQQLQLFNAMFGDSAFVKVDGAYVNVLEVDGAQMAMIFYTNGSKINGYQISAVIVDPEQALAMQMDVAMQKDEMAAWILMDMGGMLTMEMVMDGKYATSQIAPKGAPDSQAGVMDLLELMGTLTPEQPQE